MLASRSASRRGGSGTNFLQREHLAVCLGVTVGVVRRSSSSGRCSLPERCPPPPCRSPPPAMAFVSAATAAAHFRCARRIGDAALTAGRPFRPRVVPAVRACRCVGRDDDRGDGFSCGGGSGGGRAASGVDDSSYGGTTPQPTNHRREAWRQQAAAFGEAVIDAAGRGDVAAALGEVGAAVAEVAGSSDVQAAVAEMVAELFSGQPRDDGQHSDTQGDDSPQRPPSSTRTAEASASAGTARQTQASVANSAPRRPRQRDWPQQVPSPLRAAAAAEQLLLPPPTQGVETTQPPPSPPPHHASARWAPPAECRETSSSYVWRIELPGVARADLRVSLVPASRSVWVSGVKPRPAGGAWVGVKAGAPQSAVGSSEVLYGAFRCRLPLPLDADVAAVPHGAPASLRDGVLTVTVARLPPPPDTVFDIQVV